MDYPLTYNSHGSLIALGSTFIALTVIAAGIKVTNQVKNLREIDIASILLIPAFFLTLGVAITLVVSTKLGYTGSNSSPENLHVYVGLNKIEWGYWMACVLGVGFIKLSILFFFRRIFKSHATPGAFDYANWTLIGLTTAWTVTFLFAIIFACGDDPSAAWSTHFWVQKKCINTFASFLACEVFDVIIDLGIVIEPIIMIKNLHMSRARKLQAGVVFMISALHVAVVAGVIRMVVYAQSSDGSRAREYFTVVGLTYPISDLEPLVSIAMFWALVEVGVGFIVACLLPSAKLLDGVSYTSVMHTLKSVTSLVSGRRGSKSSTRTRSIDEEKEAKGVIYEQREWTVRHEQRS